MDIQKRMVVVVGLGLLLPLSVFAKIGVGVGTGKIQVDQKLLPGLIYTLPSLTVLNTGDEPGEYGVGIQYREAQPEHKPQPEWFTFDPPTFHLEPGQVQAVKVRLTLPVNGVEPGDYFSFLQGFPVKKTMAGTTSVGVAAATKLYFTVAPSNFLVGSYYRLVSLFKLYYPWSLVASCIVLAVALVLILSRFISFNVGLRVKKE